MTDFPVMPESELAALGDEAVVDYIARARDADRIDEAKRASAVLAFGLWKVVSYQVAAKVPSDDVADVAGNVIESAMKSVFDGRSVGEFRSWLRTITSRRIADYWIAKENKPTPEPIDRGTDEWQLEPGAEDGHYASFETRDAAARLLEERDGVHQMVIRLYGPDVLGYEQLPAKEVALQVEAALSTPMSEANVHQIWSRFRRELQIALGVEGS